MNGRARVAFALAGLVLLTAVLFVAAGLPSAYLAADDFQFLARDEVVDWARLLHTTGSSFYRPVVDVWFTGTTRICGASVPCYHVANLGVHLLNILLVFALAQSLLNDVRPAFLASVLFAVQPAPTQAVVWVSAVTSLLATSCYLASLLAQTRSWRAPNATRRLLAEAVALVLFATGLYVHEAVITLPVMSWIMWRRFAPKGNKGVVTGSGLAAVTLLFAVTTVLANRRNTLFTESHYTIGLHALNHGFYYLVALFVAPRFWPAYLGCAGIVAILLVATPATRFGALWLIVTLTPYLAFTWGNVSRYMYLPAVGFAWMVACGLTAAYDWASRSHRRSGWRAAVLVMSAFMVVRSALFCFGNIQREVIQIEKWRTYTSRIVAEAVPGDGGAVQVTIPSDVPVDRWYIEPILRWTYQNPRLVVITR